MDLNIVITNIEKVKITKNTTAIVYIDCALGVQDITRAEASLAAKFGCKVIVMDKRQQVYFTTNKPVKPPKPEKPAPQRNGYGEFKNVKLTAAEHSKLIERFGAADTSRAIDELSAYMESKSKRYANHYATLLNWVKRYPKDKAQTSGNVFDRIDEAINGVKYD